MTTKDDKAATLQWMVERMLFGGNVPEENLEALRRWLVDGSDVEMKKEVLRRVIQAQAHTAFNPTAAERISETTRERWRDIAEKLGMDTDIENYRAVGKKQHRSERPVVVPLQKRAKRTLWRRYALRAAAVLVPAMIVAGGVLWMYERDGVGGDAPVVVAGYVPTDSLTTTGDGIRRVTLPDGTQVILNRNSTLSFNDHREAELTGEAYFKVAKDAEQPFVIHSDNVEVTVLGTEFNFSAAAEDGESRLSLYEGSVRLDYSGGSYRLSEPGKEFVLDYATGEIRIDAFDAVVGREWVELDGLYRYHTLGDIFHSIEAKYGVKFEHMATIDTTQNISFRLYDDHSIETVLSALKIASGDFDYTINGQTITLESRK